MFVFVCSIFDLISLQIRANENCEWRIGKRQRRIEIEIEIETKATNSSIRFYIFSFVIVSNSLSDSRVDSRVALGIQFNENECKTNTLEFFEYTILLICLAR